MFDLSSISKALASFTTPRPVSPVPADQNLSIKKNLDKAQIQSIIQRAFDELKPKEAMQQFLPNTQTVEASVLGVQAPQPTPSIVQGFESRNPDVQDIIKRTFQDVNGKDMAHQAINMAAKESGLHPDTIHKNEDFIPEMGGPSTDYGLFQVNDWWQRKNLEKHGYTINDMLDAQKAAEFARKIVEAQGNKWGNTWYGNKTLGYE